MYGYFYFIIISYIKINQMSVVFCFVLFIFYRLFKRDDTDFCIKLVLKVFQYFTQKSGRNHVDYQTMSLNKKLKFSSLKSKEFKFLYHLPVLINCNLTTRLMMSRLKIENWKKLETFIECLFHFLLSCFML